MVVELKAGRAEEATYMQVWRYVSWVQRYLAQGERVGGLVVAREQDLRFKLMADASGGRVRFLSLGEVGVS